MSDELEQEVARLRGRLEAAEATQQHGTVSQAVDSSGKILKWLTTVISILAVIIGLGVNWGMTKAELSTVSTQISEIKEDRDKKEVLWKAETDKLRAEVIELQIKGAADDQWRTQTTRTLDKIEKALDKLANE